MVSSKAKTVSIVFRAELTVGGRACGMSFAKTRTRPRALGQGLGNPLLVGCCGNDGKGPSGQTGGGRQRFINHSPPPPLPVVAVPTSAFSEPMGSGLIAPAVSSTGMADGGSGDADTSNTGPTWAASEANLRDHAVRLSKRRGC